MSFNRPSSNRPASGMSVPTDSTAPPSSTNSGFRTPSQPTSGFGELSAYSEWSGADVSFGSRSGQGFPQNRIEAVLEPFGPLNAKFHGLVLNSQMEGNISICRVQVIPGEILWVGVNVPLKVIEEGEIYKFKQILCPEDGFPYPYFALRYPKMKSTGNVYSFFNWNYINTRTMAGFPEVKYILCFFHFEDFVLLCKG